MSVIKDLSNEELCKVSGGYYQDRVLTCKRCGNEFIFTAAKQAFYAEKGFVNEPQTCEECRKARRGQTPSTFDAVCILCGEPTFVPFKPSPDRPVYCNNCFKKMREEA